MIALGLLLWACDDPKGTVPVGPEPTPTPVPKTPVPTGPTASTGLPSTTGDTGTPTSGEADLTVTGGFGSGTWPVGQSVHVWADVDPQGEIITGWVGDTAGLTHPTEWNSPFVMPPGGATLSPDIVAVGAPVESRSYTLDGANRRVLVVHGEGAVRGLVLHFHGGIYAVDDIWNNAPRTTILHLVRAGFTVAALESDLESLLGVGGWDWGVDPSQNRDLARTLALIDALHDDGTVPEGTPTYAWGMSSGGQFAHSVGSTGAVEAVVAHCAAGTSAAMAIPTRPTAWYLMAADQVFPNAVAEATAYQPTFTAAGIDTALHVQPTTPLYDARFTRVPGIDMARSIRIADALRADGAVDADDQWVAFGSTVTAGLSGLDGVSDLTPTQQEAVGAEIEIMAADHELYDDVAARLVAFLSQH